MDANKERDSGKDCSQDGRKGRQEEGSGSKIRILGTAASGGNSSSGNRCMDRCSRGCDAGYEAYQSFSCHCSRCFDGRYHRYHSHLWRCVCDISAEQKLHLEVINLIDKIIGSGISRSLIFGINYAISAASLLFVLCFFNLTAGSVGNLNNGMNLSQPVNVKINNVPTAM